MAAQILATLGPSSFNRETVQRMDESGIALFRINLSHTPLDVVEETLIRIKEWTDTPICIDSEGAQIRNGAMNAGAVFFSEGSTVKIHSDSVVGDAENISFTPRGITEQFQVGDVIYVDFDDVRLRVLATYADHCMARVEISGCVGSNKAANTDRHLALPAITEKDRAAFEIGKRHDVRHFALSFAGSREEVVEVGDICGDESVIISKIESLYGLQNLDGIIDATDWILIDRDDLSRVVPVEHIPFLQRRIISMGRAKDTPVFVATNLMESMVTRRTPSRAEVNDVVSTLLMGANGVALAAETAIGEYPAEVVAMVRRLADNVWRWTPNTNISEIAKFKPIR